MCPMRHVSQAGDADEAVGGLWPQARNVWLLLSMLALPAVVVLTLGIQAPWFAEQLEIFRALIHVGIELELS